MSVKIQHDKSAGWFEWYVVIHGRTVAGGAERTRAAAMAAGKRSEKEITQRKRIEVGR